MISAIQTAEKNLDFTTYYDLRRGLELADSTRDMENTYPAVFPDGNTEPRYGWQKMEDSTNFINQINETLTTDPAEAAKLWDTQHATVKQELQELIDNNNDENIPPIIELIDKYDQLNRKIGHPSTITDRVINESTPEQLIEIATNPRLTPQQTLQTIHRHFQRYNTTPRLVWNAAMKAQNRDHLRWDVINKMVYTPQPAHMTHPANIDPWEHTPDELAKLDSTRVGYAYLRNSIENATRENEKIYLLSRQENANFHLRLNYLKTQIT